MTSRAFLILFIFFAWSGFSTWYYNCKIKGLCGDSEKPIVKVNEEPKAEENKVDMVDSTQVKEAGIFFSWDSDSAATHKLDSYFNNGILNQLEDGEKILITGKYFESEHNNSAKENLGFARAEAAKRLLSEYIDADRIELSSELTTADSSQNSEMNLLGFLRIRPEKEKEVAKRDGKVLVYFNSNSDNPQMGREVTDYLDNIAYALLADKYKSIRATGYTDQIGSSKNNYYMGLHRAKAVQDYLVSQGCNPNQIELKSYGKYRPIAENDTEEGRAKNRRVEIKLNY